MSKRELEDPISKHPSTTRAKEIDANNPWDELLELLEGQKDPKEGSAVIHWFRSKDLRIHDNRALYDASETAKAAGIPLICCYVTCEPELIWHGTSVARLDFINESLQLMQKELADLQIPLVFLDAAERKDIAPAVEKFTKDNSASHVFANYEYEIDEVHRDVKLLKAAVKGSFQVALRHDQTVIEPGTMTTGSNKPMRVFTPYHHAWLSEVKADPSLLDTVPAPSKNGKAPDKKLFESEPPALPQSRQFESKEHQNRIRKLWPAGHSAGIDRMKKFISKKISKYGETRSNPAKDSSSRMSPYFAAGCVSMREAVGLVRDHNDGSTDFTESGSSNGVHMWIREICFRELYRQTLLTIPHIAMNMPQNLKFAFVDWEDDEEGYKRWEQGTLGVPFVDAGMRQLKAEAYMHNRLRMNVSSYLYCNLLIDYRRGERYFLDQLIDGDIANNTQGWEPSYTVFNPVSQAERNDPDGDYIRKWVPELKDVQGKAVFDPYHRLEKKDFVKLGYPEPYVDWNETKARCLERYKHDMKDAEP